MSGMDLPGNIEIHPRPAMMEICEWSDYAALDVSRDSLPGLVETLGSNQRPFRGGRGQALIRVPMPCGGLAKCGVCAVRTSRGPLLACEDGPVFDLDLLIPKS
jgi:Iron-sulfur cluster binding domain of dihydroorotate dehydrogenase B